jgi:toxin ParE1/3/4
MEKEKRLPVKVSKTFLLDLDDIFSYGLETFGLTQAASYENEIWDLVESLPSKYYLFPECRHLPTKSKMYRWIILDSHLIIYRIAKHEVQVLKIMHSKRSITKIKAIRSIKI